MWEKIKQEIRERFLNFETAKGIYMIPAGSVIIYVSVYYQQYLFMATGVIFGWYCVSEGLRKMLVNRFAQARKQKEIADAREALAGGGADKAGAVEVE